MALWTRVATPSLFQGVLQGEGIDDGGEHPHVVAGGPFDAAFAAWQASKNIAAADDDDDLDAEIPHLADLLRHVLHGLRTDADAGLAAERLAAELQQNPAVPGVGWIFSSGPAVLH